MYHKEEKDSAQNHEFMRKKLVINIAISWLAPVILVLLLRGKLGDTVALAVAGAMLALKAILVLIIRRRADWIGITSVCGFAISLVVSILFNGSDLPLKLYHPIITGIAALALLVSAAVGKPLLAVLFKMLHRYGGENKQSSLKRAKIMSALFGGVFLLDATIHIIMALSMDTASFMVASRIATIILVAFMVISTRMIARRNKAYN